MYITGYRAYDDLAQTLDILRFYQLWSYQFSYFFGNLAGINQFRDKILVVSEPLAHNFHGSTAIIEN